MEILVLSTDASLEVAFQLRNFVPPSLAKPPAAIRRQELVYMPTKFVPPHLLAKSPAAIRREEVE